jgi:transcriptional regulator with XRE-family HTH domain
MTYRWRNIPGCRLFRAYLRGPSLSQREIARTLGTTEHVISSWKSGFRRPGDDFAAALERLTGVPADSWRTREELAKRLRLQGVGSLRTSGHAASAPQGQGD